jgi:gluconolactonase
MTNTYEITDVAGGLRFPEGPVALADGSVLVTEIAAGRLCRVTPDGQVAVVATVGGGANGAAIGPDGLVYVCNNGGSVHHMRDGLMHPGTETEFFNQGPDYSGGRVERVDLDDGRIEVLFRDVDGIPILSANDIIFDDTGGFWVTDTGKTRRRERDRAGVIYASPAPDQPSGYRATEALFPLEGANGVGLSADGSTLYIAESHSARLRSWRLAGPGAFEVNERGRPVTGRILVALLDGSTFDSLAVDSEGNIAVATIGRGGISVFDPSGALVEFIPTNDPYTTNICFGGPDLRTAYITCAGTGRLLQLRWPVPGLPLAFNR